MRFVKFGDDVGGTTYINVEAIVSIFENEVGLENDRRLTVIRTVDHKLMYVNQPIEEVMKEVLGEEYNPSGKVMKEEVINDE